MKHRNFLIMFCVMLVLCSFTGCKGRSSSDETAVTEYFSEPVYTETQEKISTPDETGARISYIPGFLPDESMAGFAVPSVISDSNIQIISLGTYSGAFVEDGTDEQVSNTVAAVVYNSGDKTIQHATIKLDSSLGEELIFSITTLPAGRSLIVMESGRKTPGPGFIASNPKAEVIEAEADVPNEDLFDVSHKDGKLHLVNLSDKDYRAVYVRYKNYCAGNVYLGGITYSATFDNVAAGCEYDYEAGHFFKGYSEILSIQVVE